MVFNQGIERNTLVSQIFRVLDLIAYKFLGILRQVLSQTNRFGDQTHHVEVRLAVEQRIDAFRLQIHVVIIAADDRMLDRILEFAAYRQNYVSVLHGIFVVHSDMHNEIK